VCVHHDLPLIRMDAWAAVLIGCGVALPHQRKDTAVVAIGHIHQRLYEPAELHGIVLLEPVEAVHAECGSLGHIARLVEEVKAHLVVDVPVQVRQVILLKNEDRDTNH
jgi:hypothetical protein